MNRTTKYQNSYIPATTRLWNSLSNETRALTSTKSFKKETKKIFIPEKPSSYYGLGSKSGNCLLTRFRVGMSKLNADTFKIQQSDSPHCHCGYPVENIKHFFLYCPTYNHIRQSLFDSLTLLTNENFAIKSDDHKISVMLHGPSDDEAIHQVAYRVQNYIISTKRF